MIGADGLPVSSGEMAVMFINRGDILAYFFYTDITIPDCERNMHNFYFLEGRPVPDNTILDVYYHLQ